MAGGISRRQALLRAAAGLAVWAGQGDASAAHRPEGLRVASLGYETAQTLLALGIVPLTATNPRGYAQWGGFPALPDSVRNVGLRTEPNLELLQMLKPDLIAMGEGQVGNPDLLSRIAPVIAFRLFDSSATPLQSGRGALLELAARLDRVAAAELLLQELEAALQPQLQPAWERPAFLATFIDAGHLYVYGPDSLFGEVWARLGRHNAWAGPVNRWGFAMVGPERLAGETDAALLHIGALDGPARQRLTALPLWQALPFSRPDRFAAIPAVLPFGGIASALRFARLVQGVAHAF